MKTHSTRPLTLLGLLALTSSVWAQASFNGTWRPDPQTPGPNQKPDVFELREGSYECRSCLPPYTIKADGADHSVAGNPYYDTLSVTVVDDHTVVKVGKKGGQTVLKATERVSANGTALLETRMIYGMAPHAIEVTSHSKRLSAGKPGSHALSGSWRLLDTDLTNHDEDTTFTVRNGTLAMSDRMGRSFAAKLDGTDAPYVGDSEFNSVSVKAIDDRTIEELDKKDGKVVKIAQWKIGPDDRTMHVRFDDTHGKVQEQTGHKLP